MDFSKIDQTLAGYIADKQLAGCVTLVAHKGVVVHRSVQGLKDIASGEALDHDTIFRIYSMTKPVTAVAMMLLYDQGLWSPDDAVADHLPECADVKVLADDGSLVAPERPPSLLDLLTHTMGLGYGFDPNDPVDAAYLAAGVWTQPNLAKMSAAVASCPLAFQPGTRWRYSMSMDVQGAIIEKLSGQSLPDFMRERIFKPLGMVDTDFYVPPEKMSRLATLYRMSKTKGLTAVDQPMMNRDPSRIPAIAGGGGGLFSTAADYGRFAQMLLNRGSLEGVTILESASVDLMTANHISDEIMAGGYGVGLQQIRPGYGQGFNGSVFCDPAAAGSQVGKGTYQWDGAAGTWFWVDPVNQLAFVGLIQRMEGTQSFQSITQALVAEVLG